MATLMATTIMRGDGMILLMRETLAHGSVGNVARNGDGDDGDGDYDNGSVIGVTNGDGDGGGGGGGGGGR